MDLKELETALKTARAEKTKAGKVLKGAKPEEKEAAEALVKEADEKVAAAQTALVDAKAAASPDLVEIRCTVPRFRGGIQFGPEPKQIDKSELDAKQWEKIENDPMLQIRPIKE